MPNPSDLDLELDGAQRATLSALLKGEEPIQPPEWLALEAAVNDEIERARAADDPDELWSEKAQAVEWMEPWRDGQGGLLVLRKPLPYMPRTVWRNPIRYADYWSEIPGCYSAGDVAMRDADGWFAVLGRADDVMNVAGHRIGTADVEGSLLRHPAVAESAVIGLPDPIKGERIAAYVVLKTGFADTPGLRASLKDHVREDLGPIAQPGEIEIRSALPKTRSGKIVRRYLKAQALGEDPGDLSTLAD
jgi:acetyl-CoA synthetase